MLIITKVPPLLQIYDAQSNVLLEHGGSLPDTTSFSSASNLLMVEFSSTHSSQNTGFLLQYQWVLQGQFKQL